MSTKQIADSTGKGLLDRDIFYDKSIYQQELEQVFGRSWLFVGHESQIAKPNDFVANYMGEDPILLTRDGKGKLHAFLNMCRHRGNRICRADAGNAPSFMCTYHGWTFATDGKLVGVPGYKEAYFEELDRSQWGLVETANVSSYKGLVFAVWDSQAPSLVEYMGDMAWYLDLVVDRRAGGSEVLGNVHRWTIESNWKFGADNFGGDGYHHPITHGSVSLFGARRRENPNYIYEANRHPVTPGNGHGVLGVSDGTSPFTTSASTPSVIRDYQADVQKELLERLGPVRGGHRTMNVATMFPNFTWHPSPLVRIWHPRSPSRTEVWSYCIVDKDAPAEVKNTQRRNLTLGFGPSGATEQDDMSNWIQCTSSSKGWAMRRYPMNIQMGLGHAYKGEVFPGTATNSPSENNQRAFYGRWAEMMNAPSWKDISVTPRTIR